MICIFAKLVSLGIDSHMSRKIIDWLIMDDVSFIFIGSLYSEDIFFVKVEFCSTLWCYENHVAMSTEERLYGFVTRWPTQLFFSDKLCLDSCTWDMLLLFVWESFLKRNYTYSPPQSHSFVHLLPLLTESRRSERLCQIRGHSLYFKGYCLIKRQIHHWFT